MKFLGIDNYKFCNPYTFPTKPEFHPTGSKKNCNNFLKQHYYNGNYMLNTSQILQWVEYLFRDAKNSITKFLEGKKVLDDRDDRKVIQFQFANSTISVVEKSSSVDHEKSGLLNEYFMGVLAMNYLRCKIPNFGFYFFSRKTAPSLAIYQEYIEGQNLRSFIHDGRNENKQYFVEQFISIFLQLILSLEYAQNTLQFTHFDLHSENIILRPGQNHSYRVNILLKEYEVTHPSLIPTIIDFGLSTCRTSNNKVLSNFKTFYKFGYYPFFIPGTDMARIIFDIYFYTSDNKCPAYMCIRNFLEYIMEDFYKMNLKEFEKIYPQFIRNYFNISCTSIAFRTPNDLLQFIITNQQSVIRKLHLYSLPLRVHSKQNLRQPLKTRANECFQKLFCVTKINDFCKEENILNSFYLANEKATADLLHQQLKMNPIPKLSNVPQIQLQNNQNVRQFVNKYRWFVDIYQGLYRKHLIEKQPIQYSFYKNLKTYHRFYKILCSLIEFDQFCVIESPFYADDVNRNVRYSALFEKVL